MTFGSLFSGIGGIDLGLERAGLECRWQVENDPFCTKVLRKHWPGVKRYGDIRECGSELERVDLIAGGFPCQDLSQAGKRIGIEGDRSGLWFEFARLIGLLGPRYVLIENVPGLLDRRAMPRVIGELARLGYVGCWRCLRASEFGAAHLRKRVLIVAYRSRERRREDSRSAPGNEAANRRAGRDGRQSDGKRELREPSELGRRLPDGSNETMEDAGCSGIRRTAQPAGIDRTGPPIHDCRAGGTLGDAERSRLDRCERERIRTDGSSLFPARSGSADGHLEYPARDEQPGSDGEVGGVWRRGIRESSEQLADAGNGLFSEQGRGPDRRNGSRSAGQIFSDSGQPGLSDAECDELPGTISDGEGRAVAEFCRAFAPGPSSADWPGILGERPDLAPALESPVCRVADGIPDWLDRALSGRTKRLRALGNAVVPQCAEWIGRRILELDRTGT